MTVVVLCLWHSSEFFRRNPLLSCWQEVLSKRVSLVFSSDGSHRATWVTVFRLYTLLKNRFKKENCDPQFEHLWYFMWLTFLIFSISTKKQQFLLDGFSYSTPWMGRYTVGFTHRISWCETSLRLGLGTWINRLVAQPKRRGFKGWIQRRGLPVPSSWHVTAYFWSSSQHAPVTHVSIYPLV